MLMAMVWGVVWILLALLAAILLVLATPLRLEVALRRERDVHFRLAVQLLGGMTPMIRVVDTSLSADTVAKSDEVDTAQPAMDVPEASKPLKSEAPKTRRNRRRRFLRALDAAPALAHDLLAPLDIEHIKLDADFGLGDPAETGQIYGLLCPLLFALRLPEGSVIRLRPDFSRARFDGVVEACVRFTPLAFIPPLIVFAWRIFAPQAWVTRTA